MLDLVTQKLTPGGLLVWATPTPRHFACGRGEEVEPGTWVDPNHAEGPILHHYSTEEEVRKLLHAYEILSVTENENLDEGNLKVHWRTLARKRSEA